MHNQSPDKFRAFYAIDPDAKARAQLATYIQSLQLLPWADQVKWVADTNLHLTIRFLGFVSRDDLNAIHNDVVADISKIESGQFPLQLSEPQLFPNERKARIIAARINVNERIQGIVDIVEHNSVKHGLMPENRNFKGHISLGRVRDRLPKHTSLEFEKQQTPMMANQLILYTSALYPTGAKYTAMHTLDFIQL